MKTIRIVVAMLLVLGGALHLATVLTINVVNVDFVVNLILGIVYLALFVLILLNTKYGLWLGFIIPIISLAIVLFGLFTNRFTINYVGIIAIICDTLLIVGCLTLLLKKDYSESQLNLKEGFPKLINWIAWISVIIGLIFLFIGLVSASVGRLFPQTESVNFFIASTNFFIISVALFAFLIKHQLEKV